MFLWPLYNYLGYAKGFFKVHILKVIFLFYTYKLNVIFSISTVVSSLCDKAYLVLRLTSALVKFYVARHCIRPAFLFHYAMQASTTKKTKVLRFFITFLTDFKKGEGF